MVEGLGVESLEPGGEEEGEGGPWRLKLEAPVELQVAVLCVVEGVDEQEPPQQNTCKSGHLKKPGGSV